MKTKLIIIAMIMIVISLLAISRSAIFVESNSCVGCGDCVKVCPTNAIKIIDGKAVIDADLCIECEICITSCTYNAIRKNR
jgi:ferredoxin